MKKTTKFLFFPMFFVIGIYISYSKNHATKHNLEKSFYNFLSRLVETKSITPKYINLEEPHREYNHTANQHQEIQSFSVFGKNIEYIQKNKNGVEVYFKINGKIVSIINYKLLGKIEKKKLAFSVSKTSFI